MVKMQFFFLQSVIYTLIQPFLNLSLRLEIIALHLNMHCVFPNSGGINSPKLK